MVDLSGIEIPVYDAYKGEARPGRILEQAGDDQPRSVFRRDSTAAAVERLLACHDSKVER